MHSVVYDRRWRRSSSYVSSYVSSLFAHTERAPQAFLKFNLLIHFQLLLILLSRCLCPCWGGLCLGSLGHIITGLVGDFSKVGVLEAHPTIRPCAGARSSNGCDSARRTRTHPVLQGFFFFFFLFSVLPWGGEGSPSFLHFIFLPLVASDGPLSGCS